MLRIHEKEIDLIAPKKGHAYVYILRKDSTVVYIGASINVYTRIAEHIRKKKSFDAVSVIRCPSSKAAFRLEAELIVKHRPILNLVVPYFEGGEELDETDHILLAVLSRAARPKTSR